MSAFRPFIAFACAHLTDERLFAAQMAALSDRFETRAFVFRDHDSLGGMADELLANTPPQFTLIGLSLGGYVAFEIIRRQLPRIERLALLDTTAVADHDARKAGRLADIAKVREGGIEALIPELPARWLLPAHANNPQLVALMADMARSVGANGQCNQQTAMLARPDSHADLAKVRVPTLVMCGEQDPVTPVADHRAMAASAPGARLELIPECGHLSTIEQPQRVNAVLADWLGATGSG
jgi:pimeloyl-ACP methyl ester carboxylesterase